MAECLYFLCTGPELLEYSTQTSPESQTLFVVLLDIGLNGYSVLVLCSEAQNKFSFHLECLKQFVCL